MINLNETSLKCLAEEISALLVKGENSQDADVLIRFLDNDCGGITIRIIRSNISKESGNEKI